MKLTHEYSQATRQTVITVTLDNIDARLNSYNHRILNKFLEALTMALEQTKGVGGELEPSTVYLQLGP